MGSGVGCRANLVSMTLYLSDPARADATSAIQNFFQTERDEHIGDLQAGFLLDAVLAHVGPAAFDAGVRAAQAHLIGVVSELDTVVFAPAPAPRTR